MNVQKLAGVLRYSIVYDVQTRFDPHVDLEISTWPSHLRPQPLREVSNMRDQFSNQQLTPGEMARIVKFSFLYSSAHCTVSMFNADLVNLYEGDGIGAKISAMPMDPTVVDLRMISSGLLISSVAKLTH